MKKIYIAISVFLFQCMLESANADDISLANSDSNKNTITNPNFNSGAAFNIIRYSDLVIDYIFNSISNLTLSSRHNN